MILTEQSYSVMQTAAQYTGSRLKQSETIPRSKNTDDVSVKLILTYILISFLTLLAARDQGEGTDEIAVLSTVTAKTTNRTASKFGRVYKLRMGRVEIQRLEVSFVAFKTFRAAAVCHNAEFSFGPFCRNTIKILKRQVFNPRALHFFWFVSNKN